MQKYIFIVIPMVCYMAQSYVSLRSGDKSHALMWISYAVANIGLLSYELSK